MLGVLVNREKLRKDTELVTVVTPDVSLGVEGRERGRPFTPYTIHFGNSRIFLQLVSCITLVTKDISNSINALPRSGLYKI